MIKRAILDSSIYVFSSLLTRGINILLLPLYTHILQPKDYGDIDLMYTFAAIINLVLALEVSQALGRFLPDHPDRESRVRYISSGYWFTVIVFLIFGVAMALGAPYAAGLILSPDVPAFVFIAGVTSICAQGPYLYLVNVLKWTLRPKANTIISVITSLITILSTIYTLVVLDLGIAGVFIANLAGNGAGIVMAWFVLRDSIRPLFSRPHIREMIQFSSPLVLSSAAVFISLYTDRILLKYFHGSVAVGLYGIAFRFASVVHLVLYGMQNAITPLIVNYYREEETPVKIEQLLRYFLVMLTIPILGYILFSKDVLIIFTTEEYFGAWVAMPLLTLSVIFSSIYVFTPGLTIAKETKKIALISIISAVINAVLATILIPGQYIAGAALSTLAGAIAMFGLYFYFNQKYYPLKVNGWRYLYFTLALSLSGIAAFFFVLHENFTISVLVMIMKFSFMIAASFFLAFVLISKNELLLLKHVILSKLRGN